MRTGVEGVSVDAETLVPRERVQQRIAEKLEDALQSLEKTVEAVLMLADEAWPPGIEEQSATTTPLLQCPLVMPRLLEMEFQCTVP